MDIWEMTLEEYRQSLKGKRIEHNYYNRAGQIIINHKNSIELAMQLGKPITTEVILSNIYLANHSQYTIGGEMSNKKTPIHYCEWGKSYTPCGKRDVRKSSSWKDVTCPQCIKIRNTEWVVSKSGIDNPMQEKIREGVEKHIKAYAELGSTVLSGMIMDYLHSQGLGLPSGESLKGGESK